MSTSPSPFNAIPSLQGVSDPTLLKVLGPIKENLERILGLNGSAADLYMRASEAGGAGDTTVIVTPGQGAGEPPVLPIPIIEAEAITATGTYERIILSWSVPYDYWLAHYEILRSSTSLVADAVVIGSTTSMVYSDPVGPKKTYYYWIRIVQKTEAGGNVGALPEEGKQASTVDDPSHILDVLTGQISQTQLLQALSARIDLIDAPASVAGSVNARDAGLQAQVTALAEIVDDLSGGGEFGAEAFLALEARVTVAESSITAMSQSIIALGSEIDNVGSELDGQAVIVDALGTRVTQAEGEVSAHATSIETLQTTVGGHTASLQVHAESIDGIMAEYMVKIDADGKVIGIGLASGEPGEADSSFIVRADKFAFCLPTGAGATPVVPFVVGSVGGVPTVGINGQLVVDGSISTNALAAKSVTADIVNVDRLSAISANMGDITGGTMNIGSGAFRIYANGNVDINAGTIRSTNYVAGVSGWRLTRAGALDITNLQCVGTGNIRDLAVTTLKIQEDAVTLPVTQYRSAKLPITAKAVWTIAASVAVDSLMQPVVINTDVLFWVAAHGSQSSRAIYLGYRIIRANDSHLLRNVLMQKAVPPNWTGVQYHARLSAQDDAPLSGANVYNLEVLVDDLTWFVDLGATTYVSQRFISAIGCKR